MTDNGVIWSRMCLAEKHNPGFISKACHWNKLYNVFNGIPAAVPKCAQKIGKPLGFDVGHRADLMATAPCWHVEAMTTLHHPTPPHNTGSAKRKD